MELQFLLVHFSHFWQRTINRQASRSHILSWKLPIRLSQGISPVFIFHFYFLRTDSFIRSATKNGFSGDLARHGQRQNSPFLIYCTLFCTHFFLFPCFSSRQICLIKKWQLWSRGSGCQMIIAFSYAWIQLQDVK